MRLDTPRPARRRPRWWLHLAVVIGVLAALGPSAPPGSAADGGWSPFSSFFDPNSFSSAEQPANWSLAWRETIARRSSGWV